MARDGTTYAASVPSAAPGGDSPAPSPRDILSSIGETVYDWDIGSDTLNWAPNAGEVLKGADRSSLSSGRSWAGCMAVDSRTTRAEAIQRACEGQTAGAAFYQAEYGLMLDPESRNSECLWIEDTGRCFLGEDGRPIRAHGAIRIIGKRAGTLRGPEPAGSGLDPLTGALSRKALTDCVNRLFAETKPGKTGFGMLLIAIDSMDKINRNHDYETGDAAIAAVVGAIRSCMRTHDLIARFGGNRFALLLQNCDSEQISFAAQRFVSAINRGPLTVLNAQLPVTIRAGGVCAPRDARNSQQLFQHAEEAIEAARSEGAAFVLYTPSLAANHERLRNQAISEHIIDALNQRRVNIALQPIVRASSGEPAFYEALLRIRLDDGRELSPASVIPVAEKMGLIGLLDQRVLDLAIDRLIDDPTLTISVNVSGMTALDPDWLNFARGRLAGRPELASRLIAEITETCAINDIEAMRARIAQFRETGMRVAMDDFGAGYSSFKNLRGLGIDLLKIDGAFIQNLSRSPDDRFFVRTLVNLAKHLQIPVVAEWVEDHETAALLAEWGVDYCQGACYGMGEQSLLTADAPSQERSQQDAQKTAQEPFAA